MAKLASVLQCRSHSSVFCVMLSVPLQQSCEIHDTSNVEEEGFNRAFEFHSGNAQSMQRLAFSGVIPMPSC